MLEQPAEPVESVVGHSFGAIVTLSVAIMAPHQSSALIIEDPPASAAVLDLGETADPLTVTVDKPDTLRKPRPKPCYAKTPTWSVFDASNSVQTGYAWTSSEYVGCCEPPTGTCRPSSRDAL